MVEFEIKVHPQQRLAYFPKEIVQALGFKLKAVPNRAALLLYPDGVPLEDVIKSLEIIKNDLKHALELQVKLPPRGENNECRSP